MRSKIHTNYVFLSCALRCQFLWLLLTSHFSHLNMSSLGDLPTWEGLWNVLFTLSFTFILSILISIYSSTSPRSVAYRVIWLEKFWHKLFFVLQKFCNNCCLSRRICQIEKYAERSMYIVQYANRVQHAGVFNNHNHNPNTIPVFVTRTRIYIKNSGLGNPEMELQMLVLVPA